MIHCNPKTTGEGSPHIAYSSGPRRSNTICLRLGGLAWLDVGRSMVPCWPRTGFQSRPGSYLWDLSLGRLSSGYTSAHDRMVTGLRRNRPNAIVRNLWKRILSSSLAPKRTITQDVHTIQSATAVKVIPLEELCLTRPTVASGGPAVAIPFTGKTNHLVHLIGQAHR